MSTSNGLLTDIVNAVGGTVRNPNNRNLLLEDWLLGIGGWLPGFYQYEFDGIDDYIQLPTIPLFVGDVVEFDFVAPDALSGIFTYITDSNAGDRLLISISIDDKINWDNGAGGFDVSLDEVDLVNNGTLFPSDGLLHSIKATLIAGRNLNLVGKSANTPYFPIKNLRVTRANPTDQYPNLFYPIDDGPGTTVIREVLTAGSFPELVVNGDLTDFHISTPTDVTIDSLTAFSTTIGGRGVIWDTVLETGKAYAINVTGSSDASFSINLADASTNPSSKTELLSGFGVVTFIPTSELYIYLRNGDIGTSSSLFISVKETMDGTAVNFNESQWELV